MSLDASWPPRVSPVSRPRHRVSARPCARLALAVLMFSAAGCVRGVARRGRQGAGAAGQGAVPAVAPAVPTPSSAGTPATLNIDGVRQRLHQSLGRVVLVHVWATWCAPCLSELPEFDQLAEKAAARGVQVLALAVENDVHDLARVTDVLRTRAPHLAPVIADYGGQNEFFQIFSMDWAGSIPATFVFDRTGKMYAQFLNVGEFRQMNAALDKLLEPR